MTEVKTDEIKEDNLWEILSNEKIPTGLTFKQFEELNFVYFDKLEVVAKIIHKYFDKVNPHDPKFQDNADDCYDGLCIPDREMQLELAHYILCKGKEVAEYFCENPFVGDLDLDLITIRGVSCGNSSCLYIKLPMDCKSWNDIVASWIKDKLWLRKELILKTLI